MVVCCLLHAVRLPLHTVLHHLATCLRRGFGYQHARLRTHFTALCLVLLDRGARLRYPSPPYCVLPRHAQLRARSVVPCLCLLLLPPRDPPTAVPYGSAYLPLPRAAFTTLLRMPALVRRAANAFAHITCARGAPRGCRCITAAARMRKLRRRVRATISGSRSGCRGCGSFISVPRVPCRGSLLLVRRLASTATLFSYQLTATRLATC